jgi:hypothetical protein
MRTLSASELLDIWERGSTQQPIQRVLMILAAASPQTSADALAQLSIGQRDAHLLDLRERVFTSLMESVADCPKCQERLEFTFSVKDVRLPAQRKNTDSQFLRSDGYEVEFRLPNSIDMEAIFDQEDAALARVQLLKRCVIQARCNDQEVAFEAIPEIMRDAMAEQMAREDPQADVQLALTCGTCDHQWQAPFDIVTFFLSEIDAWAQRVLRDVHILASTYGWHENDILNMSPWRRQFYQQMIGI